MKHNGKLEESFQQKPCDFPRHYLKGHIQCWDLTCFEIRKSNLTFQQLSLMCRRFWNLLSNLAANLWGLKSIYLIFSVFFYLFEQLGDRQGGILNPRNEYIVGDV